MVRKVLLGVLVVLGVLAVVVSTRPSVFHVERSAAVSAPPEAIFTRISDFHAWTDWSPWEKLDPKMERTYAGAAAGTGAAYAWKSEDRHVGQGRMTIEKSAAPSLVVVKLEFIAPFAATNTVTFNVEPTANGSTVTWSMDGKNGFLGKMFHLVMNMDKMVGGDFERGLANLKRVAESSPRQPTVANAAGPS